eukprot:PhF_6_TR41721/c0_g1_i2/m.63306
MMPPLLPPLRYQMVEENVYRGGYPTLRNFRFLQRLKLRSIISLIPEEPTADLTEFCKSNKIKLKHFPVSKFKDRVTLNPQDVANAIEIMLDVEVSHPVYVHCLDGCQNVGTVIMMLRRLQGWAPETFTSEYMRWCKDFDAAQATALFLSEMTPTPTLTLPKKLPHWFWDCGLNIVAAKLTNIKLKAIQQPASPPPMSSS